MLNDCYKYAAAFMDRGTTTEISICKWLGPTNPKYVIVGNVVGSLAVSLAAYSAKAAFECQLLYKETKYGVFLQIYFIN
jgi:threonine synthase